MKTTLLAAALIVVAPAAFAVTIDFDALDASPGQPVPLTSFSEDGYTFDVTFTANGTSPGPAIFDTTCVDAACNGDADLKPNGGQGTNGIAGNVLIMQENGSAVPDNDARGGVVTLTLVSGTAFTWMGASAVDDQRIDFGTSVDGDLGFIDLLNDGDTGTVAFTSALIGVGDSIYFRFAGSGGVDSLLIAPVPVPAALPLILGALGGLGVMARRKRRSV